MLESEEFIHEQEQLKEYEISKPTFLTQKQAEKRSQQIVQESINYNLQLRLDKSDSYQGIVEIEFNVSHVQGDIFIDYSGQYIDKVIVNNQLIPQAEQTYLNQIWNGLFLTIPLQYCNNGRNRIAIVFSNQYSNDGNGLHSFIDADQLQYIYSNNEPFYCNRIFPCFDQPDLKANLSVTIVAPKEWIIVSNEFKIKESPYSKAEYKKYIPDTQLPCEILGNIHDQNDYHFAVFKKNQLCPSYLFCFAAGSYQEIKYENPYNNILMSIYCRKSLLKYAENLADWIFAANIEAIKLYEQLFDYPFPYSKLDSIFCPEYNSGGMENIGLICYDDEYLFKEEQTSKQYTYFLITITHEISHMWFGDLVTMKWWNDLWLNESFAEFISHYIISKMNVNHKPLCNIWVLFNDSIQWGYQADQKTTTHPIAGDVENTEIALSIFDGISYSKGSAVLRQLMCLMGEQPFFDGLKAYFKKFAFKNAVLNDLIIHLEQEFKKLHLGFTIHEWQKQWIQTAGLNECQPIFNPQDRSDHAKLKIVQTSSSSQHQALRRHKIQVAFFDQNANITSYPILLNDYHETILTYDASKTEYKAVLLNYADQGYIKINFDDISFHFFKKNVNKINDILTRTLIWGVFYDLVRDGKISSEEYVDIFIGNIPNEQSEDIITNQVENLTQLYSHYTPEKYKLPLGERVFNFLLKYLLSIPKDNKNRIICVRDSLDSFARTDAHITKLVNWFKGEDQDLKHIEIGLALSWRIVALAHKIKKYTREEKNDLYKIQKERDPSDTSQYYQHLCKALDLNPDERETLWKFYLSSSNKLSVKNLTYSWSGFNSTFNRADLIPYFDKFFSVIKNIIDTKSQEFASEFFFYLLPVTDDSQKLIQNIEQLLSNFDEDHPFFKVLIEEKLDDIQRQQKAHLCFKNTASLAKHN
ncbi:hypothetical protein ABPG72_004881 [Tetrahymena utriculariae]